MTELAKELLIWFKSHGRKNLPWQSSPPNIYHIWLSEVMLQQTQVSTVKGYFNDFIKAFPDIHALASAGEDKVMALWAGLGYYSRARNLHKTAKIVSSRYSGVFPKNESELISLPGIGPSTAGAILSLGSNLRAPILDGNVKRVISRFLKKELDLLKEAELWKLSKEMVNRDDCFSYTQGIMDLGATICTPSNPSCDECPVNSQCLSAFKVRSIKKNKTVSAKKVIVMNLSLIQTEKSLLLVKNETDSIWRNLWLPFDSGSIKNYIKNFKLTTKEKIKHELTHRRLEINLKTYSSLKEQEIETNQTYKWIKKDRIEEYGIPKPISNVIKEL